MGFLRFVHLLAMAFWLGGMFTVSVWSARSRRVGDGAITAFAYATARRLYRGVISAGAWLSIVSGGIMMFTSGRPWFRPFPDHWLFQMQVVGLLAFIATVAYVVPNASALARLAERAAEEGAEPPEFAVRVKRQAIVGSLVGAALVYVILLGALRF